MREKTRFIRAADTSNLDGEMRALCEVLNKLYEMVVNDHKDQTICSGFVRFMNSSPKARLDEAMKKLSRRVYNVGFAGVYSTGKSTLINALLDEPDFLPEALQPCTMSITLIGNPESGTSERVEVKYYKKEDALRNVFENFRYRDVAEPHKAKILSQFSAEAAIEAIHAMIRELKEGGEQKYKDASLRASELEEFVNLINDPEISRRLGTVWIDSIENSGKYLTREKDGSGMGHLLLIEQVTVFKDNPLFTRHGVRIIDLPGTDDVNERQKQLTYNYLSEADAVLLLIEPKGFSDHAVKIRDELGKHTTEVRDKVFTVINMFDKMELHELSPDNFEPWRNDVTNNLVGLLGLDIEKFFVTSSLYSKLLTEEARGTITDEERKQLEAMREDLKAKLEQVTQKPLDPAWQSKVQQAFTDGGVPALRSALMSYLEKDIRIARLKDIFFFLKDVFFAFKEMLEPEFENIEDLISSTSNRKALLAEFAEKLKTLFYDAIAPLDENLEALVKTVMDKLSERLNTAIKKWCDGINFSRLRMELEEPTPYEVKLAAIKKAKKELSKVFTDIIEDLTAKQVAADLKKRLEKTPLEDVFKHMSKSLDKDYVVEFNRLLDMFENDIRKLTRMRVMEDMWQLQAMPIRPADTDEEFGAEQQKAFREDLFQIFGTKFMEYAKGLANVLWRYDRQILRELIEGFEELTDGMIRDASLEMDRISLPMNLVTGEAEKQAKEYKLLGYWQLYETAKKHYDKIEPQFEELLAS